MCSWQCGGCGVWYSYAVSSCKCSEYQHILTSTGGSAPHIHQHMQPAIAADKHWCDMCGFSGTKQMIRQHKCVPPPQQQASA